MFIAKHNIINKIYYTFLNCIACSSRSAAVRGNWIIDGAKSHKNWITLFITQYAVETLMLNKSATLRRVDLLPANLKINKIQNVAYK